MVKDSSPFYFAALVLGTVIFLLLPALSAGSTVPDAAPRFWIIVHGIGSEFTTYIRGEEPAVCESGRAVDVAVTIGSGGTAPPGERNEIVGQAFCRRFRVAGAAVAKDRGTGVFATAGPKTGTQIAGEPLCGSKYRARTQPESTWLVVCRFF